MTETGRYNEWIQIEKLLGGELLEGQAGRTEEEQSGMLIVEVVVIVWLLVMRRKMD